MYNPEGYVFGKYVETRATIDVLRGLKSSSTTLAAPPKT